MNTENRGDATTEKVKVHKIIVNGREKEFAGKEVSFEEVIKLAFERYRLILISPMR